MGLLDVFLPLSSGSLAVVHHILAVILIRLSLELPAHATISADRATQGSATHVAKSALLVWDLKQDGGTVDCSLGRFARLS